MSDYEIIRGTISGQKKYCRIPIRSKTAELLTKDGISELSAEAILDMPREQAARTIDTIIADWAYWLKRANTLFVLYEGCRAKEAQEDGEA